MDYAQGKGFLMVTGVLLIIFGAITTLSTLPSLASSFSISSIISVISGLLGIFVGILGVKNSKVLEKAQLCFTMGLLLLLYLALSSIYSIISTAVTVGSSSFEQEMHNALNSSSASINISPESFVAFGTTLAIVILVIFSIIQLIIPVLYLVGASKNKKGFAQFQQNPHENPY